MSDYGDCHPLVVVMVSLVLAAISLPLPQCLMIQLSLCNLLHRGKNIVLTKEGKFIHGAGTGKALINGQQGSTREALISYLSMPRTMRQKENSRIRKRSLPLVKFPFTITESLLQGPILSATTNGQLTRQPRGPMS